MIWLVSAMPNLVRRRLPAPKSWCKDGSVFEKFWGNKVSEPRRSGTRWSATSDVVIARTCD